MRVAGTSTIGPCHHGWRRCGILNHAHLHGAQAAGPCS